MKRSQGIAQRSITSVSWNIVANLFRVAILFVRSVLLARLLPVEVFGVYALAGSIVTLTVIVPSFGMGGAFLHRASETEDEEQTAAVHFTLKLLFTLAWAAVMVVVSLFADSQVRTALLALTVATTGAQLTQTPRLILMRRVVHRRLALLDILNALFTTVVALALAWQGVTLWALLATDFVTMILSVLLLLVWRPVWRPHLAWAKPVVRYFVRFGSRNFVAVLLNQALDRFDDIWTGLVLGETALGFYSRAYTFATYPRAVLAAPLNAVTGGTYAELKDDRRRLSKAFFRANAALVRTGFLLAGLLALIAPEFIVLLLGAKWLPMLDAFRLMLVFTLLDPIKMTVADLFIAVGQPEQVARARAVQLAVLVAGLFILGLPLGITGVALAVDLMLVVGIVILLWQARQYVDFSTARLFVPPTLGLIAGLLLTQLALLLAGLSSPNGYTAGVKMIVFALAYCALLGLWERRELVSIFRAMKPLLKKL